MTVAIAPPAGVAIRLDAFCHDCKQRHRIDTDPRGFGQACWDWQHKHADHNFEFLSPKRTLPRGIDDRPFEKAGALPWWLDYKHNADLKIAYAASAAMTITLASLASSATFVAGQEATAIVNTTNKYIDYRVTAKITTGTTPTVDKEIRVYGVGDLDGAAAWPDVFDGTDSAETVTNTYILDQLPLLGATAVSATSNVAYFLTRMLTIAEAFGFVPGNWSIFVTHATVAALNATGGNHLVTQQGIYFTSV